MQQLITITAEAQGIGGIRTNSVLRTVLTSSSLPKCRTRKAIGLTNCVQEAIQWDTFSTMSSIVTNDSTRAVGRVLAVGAFNGRGFRERTPRPAVDHELQRGTEIFTAGHAKIVPAECCHPRPTRLRMLVTPARAKEFRDSASDSGCSGDAHRR